MHSLKKSSRLIAITICLFVAGVSCTHADDEEKSQTPINNANPNSQMNPYMNIMTPMMGNMGQMNGMMNPHMFMNLMGQMNGMMNPHLYMNMMNPMMMSGAMVNPMMGMNMMGPMPGGMGMPGMGATNSNNPMAQMPGGQMMDPKQYEQWFNQWSEMMENMTAQQPPAQ